MAKVEAIIWDWVGTLSQFGGKGPFLYSQKVLHELAPKYRMAVISKVASNIPLKVRLDEIKKMGKYFSFVLADYDKTPEQFLECMRTLRVKPENTLVVDDRTVRGIQIGNKLGCQTAWIKTGKYAEETPNKETGEPTYKINSVKDLLNIL